MLPSISDVANDRLKARLSSSFDFDNEYSLKDRLRNLASARPLIHDVLTENVIRSIDELRNALSHGRNHNKKGEEIYQLYRVVSFVVEVGVLFWIGLGAQDIKKIVEGRYADLNVS
jgi:hypothetical protein